MAHKMEVRNVTTLPIETRDAENGSRTVTGYAVKWEMKSHPLGFFREQFRQGAFAESLSRDNQFAFWAHDTREVLGSTSGGNLRLFEDDIGLKFELDFMDNEYDKRRYELIRQGIVEGVSFGFLPQKQEWDESDPDNLIRTINKADLFEISPGVAFQAYPDSTAATRSLDTRGAEDAYIEYRQEKLNKLKQEKERLILETYL